MAWMRMMGADSVRYHESTVMDRADDFPESTFGYYDSRGETPLRWGGTGSEDLGLAGAVTLSEYASVFGAGGACDPATGERLAVTRRPGMELVVSAHKSVAELGVLGHVGDMHKIMDAERAATLDWLDAATRARGGRRGRARDSAPTAGLIYAHTRHATSRAGDPCPHDHVLIANLVRMRDGRGGSKAADTTLWRDELHAATIVGRLASARVAVEAGYAIEPDVGSSGRLGHWRIAGVPDEVLAVHSKRAAQIDEAMAGRAVDSPQARQIAARGTRSVKRHTPVGELLPLWRRELADIGWPVERLNRSVVEAARSAELPGPLTGEELEQLVTDALSIESALSQRKVFTLADVVVAIGPQLYGRTTSDLDRAVEAVLSSPACVPMGQIEGARRQHWSTAAVLATELAIAELVEAGIDRTGAPAVAPSVVESAVARDRTLVLTEGQESAVKGVATDGRGLSVVLGLAGSGKTTALSVAAAAFRDAGYRVLGTATSGQAARTLTSEAGIEARTLASLRWRLEHYGERLDDRAVLVLDEAGMTDDPDLLWLLAAAEAARAKVVLVGDDRQLGAVGPGGGFGAVLDRHPHAVYRLADNVRQADPREVAALAHLRHGNIDQAVSWYVNSGRVRAHADRPAALVATVEGWLADKVAGADVAMYAWRRANVAELNRLARLAWDEAGQLHGPELKAPGGRCFRAGDLVIALAPAPGKLVTSQRAEVISVDPVARTIRLLSADGQEFELSGPELAGDRLDHGYAVTVHRSQGATVERAHRLEDGGGRELAYVALSRARHRSTVHVVADDLGQAAEELSASWAREARPRWAIDQGVPDQHLGAVTEAVTALRAQPLSTPGGHHRQREVGERLRVLVDERAAVTVGTGRWVGTPLGEAVRLRDTAQAAVFEAHGRRTSPASSRWDRRRAERDAARAEDALAHAQTRYEHYVQPELRRLDPEIARLTDERDALRTSEVRSRVEERLAERRADRTEKGVSRSDPLTLGW